MPNDKILCLADLHMYLNKSLELKQVKGLVKEIKPAAVLIAGDVYESGVKFNIYKDLASLDVPVVFCLGNHEFAYSKIDDVKKKYQDLYEPEKYDVHCLDIIGNHILRINNEDINIVGNVLWYDGSMKDVPEQDDNVIISNWLDSTIIDFDFHKENENCINQIKAGFDKDKKNILLTHTCPHNDLNGFKRRGLSKFNMYSGMSDFIGKMKDEGIEFSWAICGHTHLPEKKEIHNCKCVNIGNDYYHLYPNDLKHFVIEEV